MPVDHLGWRAHRQRRPRSPHRESANRLPQVAEVPDLPTAQVPRSLRLFGWPAQVGATSDGEGLSLGGRPAQPPKLVYRQLVRGARWLRQNVDTAPPPANGLDRHAAQ